MDGALGVDLDEVAVYDLSADKWHLNTMTGDVDLDAASHSSNWEEWTGHANGAALLNGQAVRGHGVGDTDTWRGADGWIDDKSGLRRASDG